MSLEDYTGVVSDGRADDERNLTVTITLEADGVTTTSTRTFRKGVLHRNGSVERYAAEVVGKYLEQSESWKFNKTAALSNDEQRDERVIKKLNAEVQRLRTELESL